MNEPNININIDAVQIGHVNYENRLGFKILQNLLKPSFGINLEFKGVKLFSKPMLGITIYNRVILIGYILKEVKK